MRRDRKDLWCGLLALGVSLSLGTACGDDLLGEDPGDPGDPVGDDGAQPGGSFLDSPGTSPTDDVEGPRDEVRVIITGEDTARALTMTADRLYWVEEAGDLHYLSWARPHGGETTVAAKMPERPGQFAVADDHVVWTAPQSGRLIRQDLAGGPLEVLIDDAARAPVALVAGERHFYIGAADGCLRRLARAGGEVEEVGCGEGTPVVLAIAEEPQVVYWGTAEGVLYKVNAGGGEPVRLIDEQNFGSALLIDHSQVFWLDAQNRAVLGLDHSGIHGLTTVARHQYAPVGIAMDRFFIYFTTQSDHAVKMVYKGGGDPDTLADSQDQPGDLTLHDGRLYWINEAAGTIATVALPH